MFLKRYLERVNIFHLWLIIITAGVWFLYHFHPKVWAKLNQFLMSIFRKLCNILLSECWLKQNGKVMDTFYSGKSVIFAGSILLILEIAVSYLSIKAFRCWIRYWWILKCILVQSQISLSLFLPTHMIESQRKNFYAEWFSLNKYSIPWNTNLSICPNFKAFDFSKVYWKKVIQVTKNFKFYIFIWSSNIVPFLHCTFAEVIIITISFL